ncbi:hypothetical protein [Methylobacter svalbardensis]|uniref:hypothetical protein n=1 Tax=Methylobacter svalbardensis TaxID=3080016 RepID=UPI0030ED4E4C
MKKRLRLTVLLFILLLLSGCIPTISVPIGSTSLSQDKSTLIVYHEEGCISGSCDVFLDKQLIGKVTPKTPLKVLVDPGSHDIYVDPDVSMFAFMIREITTQVFDKGKVVFMRVWLKTGVWATSIRVDSTAKVESYETKNYKTE